MFVHDQAKEGRGRIVRGEGRVVIEVGQRRRVVDRALPGAVMTDEVPNLVQSQHHQQSPQLSTGRDGISALSRTLEERAKDRLHDVVGVESSPVWGGAILARQRTQSRGVTEVKSRRGSLVA